ncbi:deoxynucleoside monophosphate kinase [Bacillus phage Mater]|uniref:Deoxynucleoside monophosphate kinase n=1 Tax=Bacillus phage Mater TaxID=1540090 RepID=A0A0A0RMS5_9CAUD|nr:deoxynucleoside monophosphate kinase [Bacillus phage Mater]AIW03370.1 deoxynucleoside monophosphate kinase [Bacillus phage Mater]
MTELKIALTGKMRSGKSTVEKYLVDKYLMSAFAFGTRLKEDFHRDNPEVPRVPKPVTGYQTYGQEKRRTVGSDIWINKCFADIEKHRSIARNYNIVNSEAEFMPLVTDLRQPNEYDRLREEGYIIIRISAPLDVRMKRAKQKGDDSTAANFEAETETHVDWFKVDFEINNLGSVEDLHHAVDRIMGYLGYEAVS